MSRKKSPVDVEYPGESAAEPKEEYIYDKGKLYGILA